VKVQIPCPCPPKADGTPRHVADEVTLRDTLDFRSAAAMRNAVGLLYVEDPGAGFGDILATLSEQYILHGVESWTIWGETDGKLGPLPVTKPNVRAHLLADPNLAEAVSDAADALYAPLVILPLLTRASASSPPTPTDAPTSVKKPSPQRPRRRSKPSSTSTSPMDGIEVTMSLPDGVSSSLPSSPSAR
jgi:hypothetical protein